MTPAPMTPHTVAALLRTGEALARDHGVIEPTPEAAVWELLVEAADTLRRLPDRERGWLVACDRSAWPPVLIEASERWANAVANGGWNAMEVPRPGPPSREAIGRMDVLFALARSVPVPVDLRRAFLLASRIPAEVIAERTGCSRRTVFNARDRAVRAVALEIERHVSKKMHKSENPVAPVALDLIGFCPMMEL